MSRFEVANETSRAPEVTWTSDVKSPQVYA